MCAVYVWICPVIPSGQRDSGASTTWRKTQELPALSREQNYEKSGGGEQERKYARSNLPAFTAVHGRDWREGYAMGQLLSFGISYVSSVCCHRKRKRRRVEGCAYGLERLRKRSANRLQNVFTGTSNCKCDRCSDVLRRNLGPSRGRRR